MAQQDKQLSQQLEQERARRDDENRRRFTDQSGLEASELPVHGRDEPADTNVQRELNRNLPQQHGGTIDPDGHAEGGTRGDPDLGDADRHGGRGRN